MSRSRQSCRSLALVVVLAMSSSASVAMADEYPEQILIADGVGLAVTIAGGLTDRGRLSLLGVGLWLSASPLVHAAHDSSGDAGKSAGLRLGAAAIVTSAVILAAVTTMADTHNRYSDNWFFVSLAVSVATILGTTAIDAVYLASDDEPSAPELAEPGIQRAGAPAPVVIRYGWTF